MADKDFKVKNGIDVAGNANIGGNLNAAKYQTSAPSSPVTGQIWIDSDATASVINTNDFLLKADASASSGYLLKTDASASSGYLLKTDAASTYATQANFPSGAWTSYTPTFTNLTVGNGTINAAYNQIGKTVNVRISFTWGSTTSANSSTTIVSLPVTAKNVGTSYGAGTAYMENSGIAGYITGVVMNTASNTFVSTVIGTNGLISTNVTGQQPFTWGVGDFFQTIFTYEAA